MNSATPSRGRLFRKYVILLMTLLSAVLGASAVQEIYSSYQANKRALLHIQQEAAVTAASKIEQFITEVERQIGLVTESQGGQTEDQQGLEYLRLLRQVPAITDISYLDASGREQLRLSRLALDVIGSGEDFSRQSKFLVAKSGKTYLSPVYFREESEPYVTVSMAGSGADAGVTVAEVNLKFIWEVTSRIKVGKAGHAHVVDSSGNLIAHPNLSMVLRKTNLTSLPQVRAAQAGHAGPEQVETATIAKDLQGREVLTAHARIAPLGWTVFVEQPLEEAFEPVYSAILRSLLFVLGGLGLSVLASLFLARKIVTPIRALQAGAARIGAGDLSHRIQIQTGDELEALGEEFNRTAAQLQESYTNLEGKVEARTRDLSRALEELQALGAIGRAISSTLDLHTVLTSIVSHAVHLSGTESGSIFEFDEQKEVFYLRATHQMDAELIETLRANPVSLGEGTVGGAAMARGPVQIPDIQVEGAYESRFRDLMKRAGFRALLAVPLLREDRIVGGLVVRRRTPGQFPPDVVDRLQTFATQSLLAIQNARLYEEAQSELAERKRAEVALAARTQQLEAVRAVTAEITRELDLPSLLGLITRRAAGLVGAASGTVFLWDDAAQALVPRAWHGFGDWKPDVRLRLGEGVAGVVAQRQEGLIVNDYQTSPHTHPTILERTKITAVLAEPLLYRERLVGVIAIYNEGSRHPFAEQHRQLLTLFAIQAAIAIENARLFAELNQSYTDLQRAQEELIRSEKLRALGQMAAGIAHDLNNTLAAILGQAELLKLQVPTPQVQDRLDTLVTAAADGAQVVRRLQGFARQQLTPTLVRCDLATLVQEAVELTRPRWRDEPQRKGMVVQVRTELPDSDGLPPILGQPTEIREALTNLILNAVDAMPQGGTLTLSGRPVSEGRRRGLSSTPDPRFVELSITDTGVGMAEEIRRRVFEPFFTTKGVQGTGLGLSVVYGIMERHGGHIAVTSTPGRGTTVTLRFQAARLAMGLVELKSAPRRVPSRRLLVIDDEPMVRKTLVALLRTVGHMVTEAAGGAEGLARLMEGPVDCVLTDLGMPELTGWDVARAVKTHAPQLPVILLTGWGELPLGEPESAKSELVDRILSKPIQLEDLLGVIAEITEPAPCGAEPPEPPVSAVLPAFRPLSP